MARAIKLLIVDGLDQYFWTHRLPLANAARKSGYEVQVAALIGNHAEQIRQAGFPIVSLPISRRGTSILSEFQGLLYLRRLYHQLKPHLIHHFTLKPVIYGSIAARMQANIPVINSVTGLGYVFSAQNRAKTTRGIVKILSKVALGHPCSQTIFQNPDDQAQFIQMGLVAANRTSLIKGSGVDCHRFRATLEPEGIPVVMLATRMLWDKGVREFVEMAAQFKNKNYPARFVLVGTPDFNDTRSVPVLQLEEWVSEGIIEWWGYQENMPEILSSSAIIVLPTRYREGVPKVLIEAAASARPIVTTDMPGCREIARDGVNGLLVPPGDQNALEEAVQSLLDAPSLRKQFGDAGRIIVKKEFSVEIVIEKTLNEYQKLLANGVNKHR